MREEEIWRKLKEWLISSDLIDHTSYQEYVKTARFYIKEDNEYWIVLTSGMGKIVIENIAEQLLNEIRNITKEAATLRLLTPEEYNVEEEVRKIKDSSDIKDNYEYSLENFVKGDSNIQAFMASKAVATDLGRKWNPLFIYGDSGLGKTHLIKGIEYFVKTQKSDKDFRVKYTTSEEFGKLVVDIISQGHNSIEQFEKNYEEYDVLLIDDIQFLANRGKTNEIFFRIFNSFINNKKQIVFTSDKYPEELNGFDQRMITRFNSGLSVGITTPDFETAIGIINKELDSQNISITDEAKGYIATYFSSDVRKIKGTINKILFWTIQNNSGELITLEHVTNIFKDIPVVSIGKMNTRKIKDVVAEKFGVTVKMIDGKSRIANLVNARHLAMYLTKILLNHNLSVIGSEFGGKDHTTVINAINNVETKISKDKEYKRMVEQIKKRLSLK
ncbi:chromosomal replication initiation protein [Spiroplasma sabaudiense Ar-1343]|uniref:Chromosomal replication initiator protein DnaA n=2 Tax=Spiroplasma sabaudiense TaxID=216944 RepID=W6A8C3_9MOLU|nr:chromosomal replication initiator protein DnaA [Spiroplasma sabaudiense]AHI53413.1 chromosomal replication initiation protein [Spiroplasma sabaudiense Ar-1343]